MKILTLLGTRPEIIRLSRIIPKLDSSCNHVLVHTGQNYDPALSDVFFRELEVRQPDVFLGVRSNNFANQIAMIFQKFGEVLDREQPDRMLVLGDTNSALASILAARRNIPVYHMEAGNRCFDRRVPEEVNRKLIDHCSTVLLPYTYRSRENLLREGIPSEDIVVTGNPIFEVLNAYSPKIQSSTALDTHGLEPGKYFLCTLHRSENVDNPARLRNLWEGLERVARRFEQPFLICLHPRTADRLAAIGHKPSGRISILPPLGFFDFVRLEESARCVLTDSGTVQEECCILKAPAVTLRDVTERPETLDAGSNILSGADPESIERSVVVALASSRAWNAPAEYLERNCSEAVVRILLGFRAHPVS